MQARPDLKSLWLMMAVVATTITLTVYLGIVPAVKGQPIDFKKLENRLLSDRLLSSGELSQSAMTGGRSRGGSFSRPVPSAPSLPRSAPSRSYGDYDYPTRSVPGPVIVPYPTYAPAPVYVDSGTDDDGSGLLFMLIVLGFILLPVAINYWRMGGGRASEYSMGEGERFNDRATVTQLQVALLAQARELQRDLTQLTLNAQLDTPEGLAEMLRETVLALLRHPAYWTHVRAESQTVASRERAADMFERLSIQGRSKFSAETLVNIGGTVQRRRPPSPNSDEIASHIVVTLLVGTAHEQPLFGPVQSADDLKAALQRLGSVPPDYLLVYELLWTPQDESDSLSSDELVANYPELITL